MESKRTEFITIDIGEASLLFCEEYRLVRIDKTAKSRQLAFVFEIPDDISAPQDYYHPIQLIDRYRTNAAVVDAYRFFLSMKELKSRIHTILDSVDY